MNRKAIELLVGIRQECENKESPMVIRGCIGPRGDGYNPSSVMSVDEAEQYHSQQIKIFADTEADMVTAITMNYSEEPEGIVRAAKQASMRVAVSFTVETKWSLPTGQSSESAITTLDRVTGNASPVYYMINCAHPSHFEAVLSSDRPWWLDRIHGLRANASSASHAELDKATELDDGNPVELGGQYSHLVNRLKHLNVLGGCCGTNYRHIQEIAKACIHR